MKPSERDQLFARLDERSVNTWRTVEKIEAHLEKSNNRLRKVENKAWYILGILAVVGGAAGFAISRVL